MEEGHATQWSKTKKINNGHTTIYKILHRKLKIIQTLNKTMTIIILMNKNGQHSLQKKSKFQTTITRLRPDVWTKREIHNVKNWDNSPYSKEDILCKEIY